MKLFRHILSHLFSITLFLIIVSVFYYRTLLLPQVVVDKIEGYVSQLYSPILTFSSNREYFWATKATKTVSFDDLLVKEKLDVVEAKEPVIAVYEDVPAVAGEPVAIKAEEVEKAVDQSADITENVPEKIVVEEKIQTIVANPVEVKTSEMVKDVVPENIPDTNAEKTNATVRLNESVSVHDLLVSARNAFNHGDMAQSEKSYMQLAEADENNPDVYGELGNVYYSQGKWSEAGKAYYEAAVRLISKGNTNQVIYLQRVIEGLNAEYANKLSQLMISK